MKVDNWDMDKKYDRTFVTIGASNHTNSKRQENDFYSTDALAVTLLDKHNLLDKETSYWETACGGGRLSKELLRLGYDVVSSDKYDRGYGDVGVDFFECNDVFQGNTITNPPFKYLNDWIVHSLKITEKKVYIFGRIQTIETIDRWNRIFKHNPPIYVCPFVKRMACYKNDDTSIKDRAICYAWFIWDNEDDSNETKVKWLI